MRFFAKYPITLNQLLLAPVIFRGSLPLLHALPFPSANGLRDLAEFGGFRYGAIRTALSRIRASGDVEAFTDADGVVRYRPGAEARSITRTVLGRFDRPSGFLLAVFAFAAEDTRERQVVRDTLKRHGFQKLAQNVYINGQIDVSGIETVLGENGLSDQAFLFRCAGDDNPASLRKLAELFDLAKRAKLLTQFERDLRGFLEEKGLDGDTFARRMLAAGPVHYRITFVDEPPLPAACLPSDYPLERLANYYADLSKDRARALVDYYRRVNT